MAKLMAAVELKRTSEQYCDKVKKLKDHCRKTIDEQTPRPAFCFWLASLLVWKVVALRMCLHLVA